MHGFVPNNIPGNHEDQLSELACHKPTPVLSALRDVGLVCLCVQVCAYSSIIYCLLLASMQLKCLSSSLNLAESEHIRTYAVISCLW